MRVKGFDNIHLNDPELINHTIFKFDESIRICVQRIRQSFDPIYWAEFIIKLPQKILSYIGSAARGGGETKEILLLAAFYPSYLQFISSSNLYFLIDLAFDF